VPYATRTKKAKHLDLFSSVTQAVCTLIWDHILFFRQNSSVSSSACHRSLRRPGTPRCPRHSNGYSLRLRQNSLQTFMYPQILPKTLSASVWLMKLCMVGLVGLDWGLLGLCDSLLVIVAVSTFTITLARTFPERSAFMEYTAPCKALWPHKRPSVRGKSGLPAVDRRDTHFSRTSCSCARCLRHFPPT
jgi:hypothetical protein